MTVTVPYLATDADINAEKVDNLATRKGHRSWLTTRSATTDDETVILPAKPEIDVVKTALTTEVTEPGGWVTYKVEITNNSLPSDPVTISSLTDKIDAADAYSLDGKIFSDEACTVPVDLGFVIESGKTKTVYFKVEVTGHARTVTDVVTAIGTDDEGVECSDFDDAEVIVKNGAPLPADIEITKTADRTLIPAPGGPITYTVTIKNVFFEPLKLTSLTDDKFTDVDLLAMAIAANGGDEWLDAGEEISFTFTHLVSGDPETPHTNTVTVVAKDDEDSEVTKSDDATVSFFDGSLVTNTSYCQFDFDSDHRGNQFRLVYRPETQSTFMLNGQNPGQFYYNAFVSGTPGDHVRRHADRAVPVREPRCQSDARVQRVHDQGERLAAGASARVRMSPVRSRSRPAGTMKSNSGREVIVLSDYSRRCHCSLPRPVRDHHGHWHDSVERLRLHHERTSSTVCSRHVRGSEWRAAIDQAGNNFGPIATEHP